VCQFACKHNNLAGQWQGCDIHIYPTISVRVIFGSQSESISTRMHSDMILMARQPSMKEKTPGEAE
jgi:hypothetical protein